ncbi:hypothetical protein JTB14_009655 [Gonioctena quinquepunctata]|nr:hypothetical protein JTB14_009655 [Gonioctena quinquepunctata]
MPRSRFEQFLQYLHINDNSTLHPNNKDKIHKIRPFVISLNERFGILNDGTRKLAVDESMIIFEGRSTLKQYNPKKPIKRGFKLWCLGDQNGYIKKLDVYQGKNEVAEKTFQDFGLGGRVFLSLTENYWGTNRIIYFDNYFTSVFLLEKLKTENTLACGTVQRDRLGLPSNMKENKSFRRGNINYRVSNMDISFIK